MEALTQRQAIMVLSGAVAALLAGVLIFRACTGGGLAEPCGQTGGCRFGLTCVHQRCMPECTEDRDCPVDMRCGIVQFEGTTFTGESGPKLVCLPKADAERQVQRSVATRDNRLLALRRKRSETYAAVQQLLAVEKWTLTDEAFDEAWNGLPESVRRERPAAALAQLIMTTAGTPPP